MRTKITLAIVGSVIAALIGVSGDDVWDIRNRGVIPAAAIPRVRAFADAVQGTEATDDGKTND